MCPVVSRVQIFTSLVRFIPRYPMVFVAIVNGINSLISLSTVKLLVYRKATDFCALIFVSCHIAELLCEF